MADDRDDRARNYMIKRLTKKGLSEAEAQQFADRIPPGQTYSERWQVLDLGSRPAMDIEKDWSLEVVYKGKTKSFTLKDIKSLGVKKYRADFHCVTTWSALDLEWTGVPLTSIMEASKDVLDAEGQRDWKFLIQYGRDSYTTNAPRSEIDPHIDSVWLVWEENGKPIPLEHGCIRILIPHLYAWKSAKWLYKIEFVNEDSPGYWEKRGYSDVGDVWKEQRYSYNDD